MLDELDGLLGAILDGLHEAFLAGDRGDLGGGSVGDGLGAHAGHRLAAQLGVQAQRLVVGVGEGRGAEGARTGQHGFLAGNFFLQLFDDFFVLFQVGAQFLDFGSNLLQFSNSFGDFGLHGFNGGVAAAFNDDASSTAVLFLVQQIFHTLAAIQNAHEFVSFFVNELIVCL
ncbi:hypothetical protein D3C81_424800 [compost metagenome]